MLAIGRKMNNGVEFPQFIYSGGELFIPMPDDQVLYFSRSTNQHYYLTWEEAIEICEENNKKGLKSFKCGSVVYRPNPEAP